MASAGRGTGSTWSATPKPTATSATPPSRNAWRYRDYVISAFNHDKPFDRFVLEQLAGDELPDATAETFIALGYYRLGPWDDEPADPQDGPLRSARRHGQHHIAGLSRPDAGLRPLPQPQVRAAHRARLLQHGGGLQRPASARATDARNSICRSARAESGGSAARSIDAHRSRRAKRDRKIAKASSSHDRAESSYIAADENRSRMRRNYAAIAPTCSAAIT